MKAIPIGVTAAVLLALGAGGCAPVRDQHGFVVDNPDILAVQVGVDTKDSVLDRLGTPSSVGVFDTTSWYYLSSTVERFAFYNPRTTAREVLAIRFDAEDRVAAVERFGVERGQIINYNNDRTPTRGRELGLLEQIFGNIGQGSPLPPTEENTPGNRRR